LAADATRCLLVTDSLETGGVDEVVAMLARRLPAHGFQVAVMLAAEGHTSGIGLIGRQLIAEGVQVIDPGAELGTTWMAGWRPDVVYVHGGVQWPVDAANGLDVPVALVLHGMHDLFGVDGALVASRAAKLSGIVAVSELVRAEYLAKSTAISPELVVVIPNGVDPDKVSRADRAESRTRLGLDNEILIVSLARHCLQKNTYALVSAFDEVARQVPDAHLLVCGRIDEVTYTRQIVDLAERSRARERIHLRPNTARTDALLRAADVFVLDSFFEGWALSSMEALAAGVPSVLTDVGGSREQLAGEVSSGLLVGNPLGDPVGLTWDAMLDARYRPQQNRAELIDALLGVARGRTEFAAHDEIAEEALARFDSALSLRKHADYLHAMAAKGARV
jgi:glycosyltransferase involved in cell wall biosynthesis